MYTARLLAVTLAATMWTGVAVAGDDRGLPGPPRVREALPGTSQEIDYDLDQKIPLKDPGEIPLGFEFRKVSFARMVIRGVPSEAEIASASALSTIHPVPVVFVKSGAAKEVRVLLDVTLEDEQGNVYLRCKRATNLDPGEEDDMSVCLVEPMYTRDWGKAKVVHYKIGVGSHG